MSGRTKVERGKNRKTGEAQMKKKILHELFIFTKTHKIIHLMRKKISMRIGMFLFYTFCCLFLLVS